MWVCDRRILCAALLSTLLSVSAVAAAAIDGLQPVKPQPAAGTLKPGLAVR